MDDNVVDMLTKVVFKEKLAQNVIIFNIAWKGSYLYAFTCIYSLLESGKSGGNV